jgi:hypothetical protein
MQDGARAGPGAASASAGSESLRFAVMDAESRMSAKGADPPSRRLGAAAAPCGVTTPAAARVGCAADKSVARTAARQRC